MDEASRQKVIAKLDSHIVQAIRKVRREAPFDRPTNFDPDLKIEPDGRVLCDLTATVNPELLTELTRAGSSVIASYEKFGSIRALIPLSQIESLALREDIRFIAPAAQATTNSGEGSSAGGNQAVP